MDTTTSLKVCCGNCHQAINSRSVRPVSCGVGPPWIWLVFPAHTTDTQLDWDLENLGAKSSPLNSLCYGCIKVGMIVMSLVATVFESILTSKFKSEMGLYETGSRGSFLFFLIVVFWWLGFQKVGTSLLARCHCRHWVGWVQQTYRGSGKILLWILQDQGLC